jgi:hypothetical protein
MAAGRWKRSSSRPWWSASPQRISENNHRHFYRRWAQLMVAETWADLESRNAPAEPVLA